MKILKHTITLATLLITSILLTSCINPEAEAELHEKINKLQKEVKILKSNNSDLKGELTELQKYVGLKKASKRRPAAVEIPPSADVFKSNDPRLLRKLKQTIHTLTSNDGKKIKAEILNVTDILVTIRRDNGQEYTFQLDRLINDDQAFLTEWRRHKEYADVKTPPKDIDSEEKMNSMFDSLFNSK